MRCSSTWQASSDIMTGPCRHRIWDHQLEFYFRKCLVRIMKKCWKCICAVRSLQRALYFTGSRMCRVAKLYQRFQRTVWMNATAVNQKKWYIFITEVLVYIVYKNSVMDQRLDGEFWAPVFSEILGSPCGLVVATLVARTVRCLCITLASPFYRFLARYSGERDTVKSV